MIKRISAMIDDEKLAADIDNNFYLRNIRGAVHVILSDTTTTVSAAILSLLILLAIFGPVLAPFNYSRQFFSPDGALMAGLPPMTGGHILGTTSAGYDTFSRLLYGTRTSMIVGLVGGVIIITIGTTVGVLAGYFGGVTEMALMRLVDFWYAIPFLPAAIVALVFFGVGLETTILVLGVLLWRSSARVLRSQVLQIKERPYIEAVRATGASNRRIIIRHILPNIASMIVLFFSLGVGVSILIQANLAFLGLSDPYLPTWGIMVRNAYSSGNMAEMWWWSLPPGFMIGLTVLCTFLLGRGYESVSSRDAVDGGGADAEGVNPL